MSTCRFPATPVLLLAIVSLITPLQAQDFERSPLAVAPSENGHALHVLVGAQSLLLRDSPHPILDARWHAVPGSTACAVTWREVHPENGMVAWSAVSTDGHEFSTPREARHELMLRHARHDPLLHTVQPQTDLQALATSRLFVVQYETRGLSAFRTALRKAGAEPILFVPWQADVCVIDPADQDRIRALSFVRAVVPYHPVYRLSEDLVAPALGLSVEAAPVRVNVMAFTTGDPALAPIENRIETLGGVVFERSPETGRVSAILPARELPSLLRLDHVQWIDRWFAPENDMDIVRAFHGADFVESVGAYRGQGVRVEVLDSGCDTNHPDITGWIIQGNNTADNHGTACSGIVAGTGAGDASARGVAPEATLVIADYNGQVGSRFNHVSELQNASLPFRCVLQTNSWGNGRTRSYSSYSNEMDQILFSQARISILQSQSNAGNQDSRPQAWAKNIISVGGVRHQNTLSKADDQWNFGASIGPAEDGRIKPDLASFYDSTYTTDRPGSLGYTSTNYVQFGGTSGATPIVAGHLALMYQMWSDGAFGNATSGSDVFDNRPWNTTIKALMINTASQWNFSGSNADLSRVKQGWGHPDLTSAWNLRNELLIVDETDVLGELESTTHTVQVAAGTPEFHATMIFRDPAGTTSSTLHRINDLDLQVISPSGTVYWGNNGLLSGTTSSAGGSANTVDTVENVIVANPEAGTWQVIVRASEINVDAHVETGAVDDDYALVVGGISTAPPAPPVAGFSGTPTSGTAPLTVSFSDESTGSVSSWSWTFGDGATSNAASPSHTYTTPGTYSVSLTVSGPAGSDSVTRNGYVTVGTPAPTADFSGTPTTGLAPLNVAFSDASSGSITSWSWNFGDGNGSTARNPGHTYTSPGTYAVSLTVTGPGGSDTRTRNGYVTVADQPPTANFSGSPLAGTAPLLVSFNDFSSGAITGRTWSFGDGTTSTATNPAHTYTTSGTYTVSLTVTGPGGSDTQTRTGYVNVAAAAPTASFTASNTNGNAPLDVIFTDTSSGEITSWSWNFGDGNVSSSRNPVHTYSIAGTYTVSLTVTGPGGSDTTTSANLVTVSEPPQAPTYYFSFVNRTNVPGVGNVQDEDIVSYDAGTGQWALVFDGSDVGLGGTDINAFSILGNGDMLISINTSTFDLPGLIGGPNGTQITENDIVRFTPSSLGSSTSGTFTFHFDGSDVGASAKGQDIDGIHQDAAGTLFLSFTGNGTVGGRSFRDEDVIAFVPEVLGGNTRGSASFLFDGSDIGQTAGAQDTNALSFTANADLVFSTTGNYTAGAHAAQDEDLSLFTGTYGNATSGSLSLLLDLTALGINGSEDVDGFHIAN